MQHNEDGKFVAAAASPLNPFRRVTITGVAGGATVAYSGAGAVCDGITMDRADATGDKIRVDLFRQRPGTFEIEAGKTIPVNTMVYGAADGKVSDAASGLRVGRTLKAAGGSGAVVEVVAVSQIAQTTLITPTQKQVAESTLGGTFGASPTMEKVKGTGYSGGAVAAISNNLQILRQQINAIKVDVAALLAAQKVSSQMSAA